EATFNILHVASKNSGPALPATTTNRPPPITNHHQSSSSSFLHHTSAFASPAPSPLRNIGDRDTGEEEI
ncbi:hypothetical protein A2U01_0110964, partial [Trifolium medium]|nr:hypothetical protein [Trifolium medium]